MIATAENIQGNQGQLPPSERDFELYQWVQFENH